MVGIADEEPWDLRDIVWSRVAGSLASDGVYMKALLTVDGASQYLKLSRYDSYRGIYGHESVNELIACRLGKLLGFCVPEGTLRRCLVRIDGKDHVDYVFAAQSYKTAGSRVAFEDFYVDNRLSGKESPLDLCKRFGWSGYIYKMFIFDYLVLNRDRHGANLEVMKNGGIRLSPYLDNGLSFICSCTNDAEAKAFNTAEDRPVNNFIGEKRLALNLNKIDKQVKFNELKEPDMHVLFDGLSGVLSDCFLSVIWKIIWSRWQDVAKFRIA
ncbi:MAG: hypothetical protein FWG53_11355 [Clostridiales bacterium]|nr:hypothetical protein [Clostridiales bacterium]